MRQKTAFEKWLLLQAPEDAVSHMLQCFMGSRGEMAWELMERVNGPNWKCKPADLPGLVARTIDALKEQP